MEIQLAVTVAFQLAMGVSLAACAGFRAFVPLLVVGLAGRFEVVPLADRFDWLASGPALLVLATAVVLEILADKVPVVDHFLDATATFVRPVAGAIALASPLTGVDPLVAMVIGIVLGSTVAGGVHLAKSQTRLASTAFTGASANPALSVTEDVFSIGGSVLAVVLPLVAFAVACLLLLAIWRLLSRRRSARHVRVAAPPST